MRDTMITAVVTRKWPLAQGYHAVELETKSRSELPHFADGAIVDLMHEGNGSSVRSHPLWRIPSRRDAFILGVRHEANTQSKDSDAEFCWDRGEEVLVGLPRSAAVSVCSDTRYVLFCAGVGVTVIAGVGKRLAYSGRRFEIHNFARTSERAIFREELDEFRGIAEVHHNIGLDEEALENAVSLAVSPAHAHSQIICCGPPSFMQLVERHARAWVYPSNVHRIVLGAKTRAG